MQFLVLALLLVIAVYGCSSSQIEVREPTDATCIEEIDRMIALHGVVVNPMIDFGDPLPQEVVLALTDEGLSQSDFETSFVLNSSLILHSADGWSARAGSSDAVVELALLKDVETEEAQWLVLYWRVRVPCTGQPTAR